MGCSFLFAKCSPQILRGETMFLTLRGSAGLRGRGQNGHSAVHRRIQHLVLPEIFHQDILTQEVATLRGFWSLQMVS